jgi:hypothetical protein
MGPGPYVLVVVSLSSLGAWLWFRRRGWGRAGLRAAAAFVLECLGLGVLFYAGNLMLGLGLALASRAAGGPFVSSYWSADVTLPALSCAQALLLRAWWASSHPRR